MYRNSIAILLLATLVGLVDNTIAQDADVVTCTGTVVNAREKPVGGAQVKLFELLTAESIPISEIKSVHETVTDGEGKFVFRLKRRNRGFHTASIVVQKQGLSIGRAGWTISYGTQDDLRPRVKLGEPLLLRGVVVDEGKKPIVGASVSVRGIAWKARPGCNIPGMVSSRLFKTSTDSAGRFSFNDLPADAKISLLAERTGKASIRTTLDPGDTDAKIEMSAEAVIEGVVVEKDSRKRIANVFLDSPTPGQSTIVSGEDGTFRIRGLTAGKYSLQTARPGQKLADWVTVQPAEVSVEAGETKSGVQVEVSKGGLLEVVTVDEMTNMPVENAWVSGGAGPTAGPVSERLGFKQSDSSGVARYRLLPGQYQLGHPFKLPVYGRQFLNVPVVIEDGKTKRVELPLIPKAKITGSIRDEKGRPVVFAKVGIGSAFSSSTNKDGIFEMYWNPQRSRGKVHYLTARHEERNLVAVLEIEKDTGTTDVTLKPGVICTGKLLGPEGNGISGVQVGPRGMSVYSDAMGCFEIRALLPGQRYEMTASVEGYTPKKIILETDSAVDNHLNLGELTLSVANLSVSGMVVDAEGKPVPNATISCYNTTLREGGHRRTKSQANGKFMIDKMSPGIMSIEASEADAGYGEVKVEAPATDVKIVVTKKGTYRLVPKEPTPLVGKTLPSLRELNAELAPEDTNNRMILVCFFDMDQRPSRYLLTQLAKQAKQLRARVTIVAVQAAKAEAVSVKEWAKRSKTPFPVGMIQGEVEKAKFTWGVKALPWLILTDPTHVVSAEGFRLEQLDEKIKAAQN